MLASNGQVAINLAVDQAALNQDTSVTLARNIQAQGRLSMPTQSSSAQIESGMETLIENLNRLACMEERFDQLTQGFCTAFDNLQRTIPLHNTLTTWHQAPVHFEDAFGRVYPIPSEYDYTLVAAIIKHRFSKDAITFSIWQYHHFVLHNVRNNDLPVTSHDFSGFLPGAYIQMALCRLIVCSFPGGQRHYPSLQRAIRV